MQLETGLIRRRRARVEVIPLIDCMFILLVFFIYSMLSMTIQRGLPVNLPPGRGIERITDEAVAITITRDGEVYLNRRPMTIETLIEGIASIIGESPQPRLVINADAAAAHGVVFRVLSELRNRGWTNIAILSTERVEP